LSLTGRLTPGPLSEKEYALSIFRGSLIITRIELRLKLELVPPLLFGEGARG